MNRSTQVLVVDDDENDLQMILSALARQGLERGVTTLHDGADALDYLNCRGEFKDRTAENPTMLLLDLNMPRVDGWEVLRQIKADAALRNIPVVVFTSSARDQDVLQCYELGANAYVVKPISLEPFMDVIRDINAFWVRRNHPPPETCAATGTGSRSPLVGKPLPT